MDNIHISSTIILYNKFPLVYVIELDFVFAVARALLLLEVVEIAHEFKRLSLVRENEKISQKWVIHEFKVLLHQELFVRYWLLKHVLQLGLVVILEIIWADVTLVYG